MQCEVCKGEEALVHLTQLVGGKMETIDLCDKCAKEKGIADPLLERATNLLSSDFEDVPEV